jgi:hypothetical protein
MKTKNKPDLLINEPSGEVSHTSEDIVQEDTILVKSARSGSV